MKKSILFTLLLCSTLAFSSFAQDDTFIKKGSWMAGGNLHLDMDEHLQIDDFSVSPSAGYFVSRRIAVGLKLTYRNALQSAFQTASSNVFTRYYFGQHRVAPFAELGYGFGRSRYKYTMGPTDETTFINTSTFDGGIGLNYFVSKNVALEGVFRYNRDLKNDLGSYNFNVGLQFFFGRTRD
jgi:opacity protein-like surface antigen